jgi:hypothetical protein
MGLGESQAGGGVLREFNDGQGSQFAEDDVDHAGSKAVTGLLGEFHAIVDGRVRRDAIEVKDLECAEPESDENFRFKAGVGMLEQGLDLVVEANLPAEGAENKRGGQIAVGRGENVDGFAAQQIVRVGLATLDGDEDVEGGFSRGRNFCETVLRRCLAA